MKMKHHVNNHKRNILLSLRQRLREEEGRWMLFVLTLPHALSVRPRPVTVAQLPTVWRAIQTA
jgi:hypothetical protein